MTEQEFLTNTDPAAMLGLFRSHHIAGQFGAPARFGLSDRKMRLFACACAWQMGAYPDMAAALAPAETWADTGRPASAPSGRLVEGQSWCYLDAPDAAREWVRYPATSGYVEMRPHLLRDIIGNPFRPVKVGCSRGIVDCGIHAPAWLTPQVISLAKAAYEERPGRRCERCGGSGEDQRESTSGDCPHCRGAGRIEDGLLDDDRLAILADALEDAGCPMQAEEPSPGWFKCRSCGKEWLPIHKYDDCDGGAACEGMAEPITVRYVPNPLLAHLRSPGPHVRGMWSLDCILGKE